MNSPHSTNSQPNSRPNSNPNSRPDSNLEANLQQEAHASFQQDDFPEPEQNLSSPRQAKGMAKGMAEGTTEGTGTLAEGMGILAHLAELRVRLIKCGLVLFVLFLICWAFDRELAALLLAPLQENLQGHGRIIVLTLPEGFLAYLNVSLAASIFLASPYLFYQAWAFASPGLKSKEKKMILPIAFGSAGLFLLGGLFAYFVIFPFSFQFFIDYAKDVAAIEPSLRLYLGLAINILLAFGFVFQLPVAIFFLAKLHIVSPQTLAKKRRYAILGAFIIGAILTPPDPISQILMAVPLIVLYEASILIARRVYSNNA